MYGHPDRDRPGTSHVSQRSVEHLGIKPGEKIEHSLLPQGRAELKAARRMASIESIFGFLKGKGNGKVATVEEINETMAKAGAKAGMRGL